MRKTVIYMFATTVGLAAGATVLASSQTQQTSEEAVQSITSAVKTKNPTIVLLAENHRDWNAKTVYKAAIDQIRKETGKRVCYFHELAKPYQSALDGLAENGLNIPCFMKTRQNIEQDFKEVFGRDPNLWLNLTQLTELAQSGVKLVAVDKQPTRQELIVLQRLSHEIAARKGEASEEQFDQIAVRDRSQFMANEVIAKFKELKCEIGFFSVGKDHVFPSANEIRHGVVSLDALIGSSMKILNVNAQSCAPSQKCQNQPKADLNILIGD